MSVYKSSDWVGEQISRCTGHEESRLQRQQKENHIKYVKGDWSNGSISFFLSSWNKEIMASQKCSLIVIM